MYENRIAALEKQANESYGVEFPLLARLGVIDMKIKAFEEHKIRQVDENRKISKRVDEYVERIEALSKGALNDFDELQRPINHQAIQMDVLRNRIKALEDKQNPQVYNKPIGTVTFDVPPRYANQDFCEHEWNKDHVLTSCPAQVACKKCLKIKFL